MRTRLASFWWRLAFWCMFCFLDEWCLDLFLKRRRWLYFPFRRDAEGVINVDMMKRDRRRNVCFFGIGFFISFGFFL